MPAVRKPGIGKRRMITRSLGKVGSESEVDNVKIIKSSSDCTASQMINMEFSECNGSNKKIVECIEEGIICDKTAGKMSGEVQLNQILEEVASWKNQIQVLGIDLIKVKEELGQIKNENISLKEKVRDLSNEVKSMKKLTKEENQGTMDVAGVSAVIGVTNNGKENEKSISDDGETGKEIGSASVNKDNYNTKSPVVPCKIKSDEILVLGDSLLKYAGERCKRKGQRVRYFPGMKIRDMKEVLRRDGKKELIKEDTKVILVHVGSNDLENMVSPEYLMGDMLDLVGEIREQSSASIVISEVLHRRDVARDKVRMVNRELEWMCKVRGIHMVEGNKHIKLNDLASDGLHLNQLGALKFGELIANKCEMAMSKN